MNKTIIVSNRLPLQVSIQDNLLQVSPSVGGLATGMKSVHKEGNGIWIGWSGIPVDDLNDDLVKQVETKIKHEKCISVPLTSEDIELYYEGFSNRALWPLFHYFMEYAEFDQNEWEAYKRVNEKFAQVVVDNLNDGDTVWVHDYQLLLLPKLIKAQKPNTTIGFFLHIPFPSYEIFRTFPWRQEILSGMLGAELIGFHTYDYERHFLSSIQRILRLDVNFNEIDYHDRIIKVDSFPMGIDYDKFYTAALKHQTPRRLKSDLGKRLQMHISEDKKLILSIDRMDYTKGIPNRIKAFEFFLDTYPEYKEKVRLVMLVVPSRSNVQQYQELKRETDELVGRINGKFATVSWTPIWYFYRAIPFEDLIDLYVTSDVALITPIRDGMNLVAKEFIATKTEGKGVLILSEMAGASKELNEALLINPNNLEDFAANLKRALTMPLVEQKKRLKFLQKRIKRYDVEKWAQEFLKALSRTTHKEHTIITKKLKGNYEQKFIKDFNESNKPILFLDYDGTLAGFKDDPKEAKPNTTLYNLLDALSKKAKLVLISGRDKQTFERWFGKKGYTLVTDHGVWLFENDVWTSLEHLKTDWMQSIRPILETFVDRTPGTFIETKSYSLAWHYRKADLQLAKIRTIELNTVLTSMVANNDLSILNGNKVIEIKNSNVNKGRALARLLTKDKYDFVAVIGDDWTDEYMFEEAPEHAHTIKVGLGKTKAKYQVTNPAAVHKLLGRLLSSHTYSQNQPKMELDKI